MSGLPSPGGVSPLLGGLSALASAVPAFFQGREMGMQNRLEQERLNLEQQALQSGNLDMMQKRLGILGPAAAIGAPGALDAFKQTLSSLSGLGEGAPASGQPMPQTAMPPGGPGGASPVPAAPGTAPQAGTQPQAGGEPGMQDRQLLESMGYFTPAQQFAQKNLQMLMKMQPNARVAALRGAGLPMSPQDEQDIRGIAFQPDPTLQNEALKALDSLVSGVQGGHISPDGYLRLIEAHAPQLLQAGVTPDLIAGLTTKHMTQLTQSAQLNNQKLYAALALDKANINRINKLLPGEIAKNAAQTFAAYATGNRANVEASEMPEKLQLERTRVATGIANLQTRTQELALKLQAGTTSGSPANIVNGLDKQIGQQLQQLTNLRAQYRDFFLSKNGRAALSGRVVKNPDGSTLDPNALATQIQGLTQTVASEAATAAGLRAQLPDLMNAQLHAAGTPGNVHIVGFKPLHTADNMAAYTKTLGSLLEAVGTAQMPYDQAVKEVRTASKLSPSQKSAALMMLAKFKP